MELMEILRQLQGNQDRQLQHVTRAAFLPLPGHFSHLHLVFVGRDGAESVECCVDTDISEKACVKPVELLACESWGPKSKFRIA